MAVKIPRAHKEPLKELARMDASKRARLLGVINTATAVLDPDDLVQQVTKATDLESSRVDSIIWMLTSMYRAADGDPHRFAVEAVDAAKNELSELKDASVDWPAFTRDLEMLLACDHSLGVTAKVWSVRREYGNLFCSARILTDIRPVFGVDASQAPLAAAIVHTLRITHHAGESHEDFYVALDAADLRRLREQIDRAIKKENTLRNVVEASPMKYLAAEDS